MTDHRIIKSVLLEHHLLHNHVPPVPRALFPFIDRAIEIGPTDDFVTLERGGELLTLEIDGWLPTAADLIKQFHLEIFVDDGEEEHDG